MFDLNAYLWALGAVLAFAGAGWLVSLAKRDVGIVDSMWSVMFLLAAAVYWLTVPEHGPRSVLLLVLVSIWAIRLSAYITWRNWGEEEDRRYQEIRRNNEPNFALKAAYIVFGLQAALAWTISLPLLGGINSASDLGFIDFVGIALWVIGMIFEAGGDYQLARFKANPESKGKVLDDGLWRYTRHPNYFGDFCVWWGFFLIALAAGAWWSIIGPILMTFLLLKVSGVAMLEKDISNRRPEYRDYVERTNAFFPGPPSGSRAPKENTAC